MLVNYMHATDEKVVPILNEKDINYLFGKIAGCFLRSVQDLIWELWACSMAPPDELMAVGTLAATHVACHHRIVLCTLCLFLFPI